MRACLLACRSLSQLVLGYQSAPYSQAAIVFMNVVGLASLNEWDRDTTREVRFGSSLGHGMDCKPVHSIAPYGYSQFTSCFDEAWPVHHLVI